MEALLASVCRPNAVGETPEYLTRHAVSSPTTSARRKGSARTLATSRLVLRYPSRYRARIRALALEQSATENPRDLRTPQASLCLRCARAPHVGRDASVPPRQAPSGL